MNIHICCVESPLLKKKPNSYYSRIASTFTPYLLPVLGMLMGRLNFGMLLHVSRFIQFLEDMSPVKSAFTPGPVFLCCKTVHNALL